MWGEGASPGVGGGCDINLGSVNMALLELSDWIPTLSFTVRGAWGAGWEEEKLNLVLGISLG